MSHKVLRQTNLNDNALCLKNQKSKTLDIDDLLIVSKISGKEFKTDTFNGESSDYYSKEYDEDEEHRLLAEEQEAIIKKQIQMLQADERGKQALISEIAILKEKQNQRDEALKTRQRVLGIEKERAKRIASLPPPLLKSVKDLLRKNDDHKPNDTPVHMPDELTAVGIKLAEFESDNKENILDPEEQKAKEKMQEERNTKAKKRFNEALRKDRQKEEYENIMKQIESAELRNRREMAKNISSDKAKTVPCPLSDKFQTSKNQVDIDNTAEKLFKKNLGKEHVIEDIEGYEDHYEERYKNIDYEYEARMIDCVPDFVKENYEYLLEDETKFEGGKNFSGLDDDESDVLNVAYIESPPHEERENIDHVIDNLEKLRSKIQSEYDQTLKPLLIASLEVPKKEVSDKAVETDRLKSYVEDKAVETDVSFERKKEMPPLDSTLDFGKYGVMARKMRPYKPVMGPIYSMPDMHHREVYYPVPPIAESEGLEAGVWSSSSYCSLPSKHGFPTFTSSSDSPKCDICAAEKEKQSGKDILPNEHLQSALPEKQRSSKLIEKSNIMHKKASPETKSDLSIYVQQLAEKYLKQNPKFKSLPGKAKFDSNLPMYSQSEHVISAFEKETVPKSYIDSPASCQVPDRFIPVEVKDRDPVSESAKQSIIEKKSDDLKLEPETVCKFSSQNKHKHMQDSYIDKTAESVKSPMGISEYDVEVERIKLIHQVLSQSRPCFNIDTSRQNVKSLEICKDSKSENILSISVPKTHVYHELSTIQEVDSALIDSFHASHPELSAELSPNAKQDSSKSDVSRSSSGKLKVASLIDPPDTKISELAKSIHFVPNAATKASDVAAQHSQMATELLQMASPHPEIEAQPQSTSFETLSTITTISKCSSLSSPLTPYSDSNTSSTSSVSHSKVLSSSLAINNKKYPFLKDTKILSEHFKNVSDIQSKQFSYFEGSLRPQTPLSPSIISSSSSSQSIPSAIDTRISKIKQNVNKSSTAPPLISGFRSDTEVSDVTSPNSHPATHRSDKCTVDSKSLKAKSLDQGARMTDVKEIAQSPTANSLISGFITNIQTTTNSPDTYYTMTPHTHVSTPVDSLVLNGKDCDEQKSWHKFSEADALVSGYISDTRELDADSSGTFHPLTPHTHLSTPDSSQCMDDAKVIEVVKNRQKLSEADALTSKHINNIEISDGSIPGTFCTLTPHFDISSPDETFSPKLASNMNQNNSNANYLIKHTVLQKSSQFEHNGNVKPVSPQSDLSVADLDQVNQKKQSPDSTSSGGSYTALTPHSHLSSPISTNSNIEVMKKDSTGSSKFYPLKVRLDISPSRSESSRVISLGLNAHLHTIPKNVPTPTLNEEKPLSSLNLARIKHQTTVGTKLKILAHPCGSDYFVPDIHSSDKNSLQTNIDKHYLEEGALSSRSDKIKPISSLNVAEIKYQSSSETKFKRLAHPCSSDYFVPEIRLSDVNSLQTKIDKNCLEEGTLSEFYETGSESSVEVEHKKMQRKYSSKDDENISKQYMSKLAPDHQKALEESIRKTLAKKFFKDSTSKQNVPESEQISRNVKKQYSTLQAISSNSSSENLSDMFSGSKIVYQSTPIKSSEESVKEAYISDEPELTFKDFTYSSESIEIHRENLIIYEESVKNIIEEKDSTLVSSSNDCKTPTMPSSPIVEMQDTPSLLSFLKHEKSCEDNSQSLLPIDDHMKPSETKTPSLKDKTSLKSSEPEYKKRTKRLWSNLEEVRKRKLADERKKIMAHNRLKAREFSKKVTPKKN